MSLEGGRISAGYLYQQTLEFIKLDLESGVNNYTLDGPVNVPTKFDDFASMFPGVGGEYSFALLATTPDRTQDYYYDRILGLSLPERIRSLHMVDDPDIRALFEKVFMLGNLPSMVLAFGVTRDTKEE